MRGQGSDDVVPMMTGLTGVRLKVEFSFYKQTKQTDVFLSFPFSLFLWLYITVTIGQKKSVKLVMKMYDSLTIKDVRISVMEAERLQ